MAHRPRGILILPPRPVGMGASESQALRRSPRACAAPLRSLSPGGGGGSHPHAYAEDGAQGGGASTRRVARRRARFRGRRGGALRPRPVFPVTPRRAEELDSGVGGSPCPHRLSTPCYESCRVQSVGSSLMPAWCFTAPRCASSVRACTWTQNACAYLIQSSTPGRCWPTWRPYARCAPAAKRQVPYASCLRASASV